MAMSKKCTFILSLVLLLAISASADRVCSLVGDPHLSKWNDPTPSDWIKKPSTTALGVFCGNKVEIKTAACNYNNVAVSCVVETTVAANCNGLGGGQHVAVKGDQLIYEDVGNNIAPVVVSAPFSPNACLKVVRNGPGDYTFILPDGNVHVWGWSIPPYLGGPAGPYENVVIDVTNDACPLSGACGDDDGPVFSPAPTSTPEQHWDSWAVGSICESITPFNSKSEFYAAIAVNNSIVYPSSPVTTTDPVLQAKAEAACAVLKTSTLVTQCAGTISAASFYQACLDDVILTTLVNFAADNINAFAIQCASRSPTPVALPTSAAFSTVAGNGLSSTIPQYSTVSFTIYSRDVNGNLVTTGGENYVVTSTGPATLKFTIVNNNDGTYTVTYTVLVTGTYTIEVRLNGVDSVRGAPITNNVVAGACANFVFDGLAATIGDVSPYTLTLKPVTPNNPNQQWKFVNSYIVSCSSKSTYVFDVVGEGTADNTPVGTWTQKTGGNLNNQRWTYNTTASNFYSLNGVGLYLKHVTSNGVDSLVVSKQQPPQVVVIQPPVLVAQTAAAKSTASGPGLGLNLVPGPQTFTIYARDTLGNPRTTGGDSFTVLSSPALSFKVKDNGDGTYAVTFTAAPGAYTIQVKFAGSQISGSPFSVSYLTPGTSAGKSVATGPGIQPRIEAGVPLQFIIQAKDSLGNNRNAGGDVFVVTFNPPLDGTTPFGPIDNLDGTYTVQYEQDDVIQFQIGITLGGQNIQGSPYQLQSVF